MLFANGYGIYDHEAVIWLGCLNYRLNLANYEDVVSECNTSRFGQLLIHDQVITCLQGTLPFFHHFQLTLCS